MQEECRTRSRWFKNRQDYLGEAGESAAETLFKRNQVEGSDSGISLNLGTDSTWTQREMLDRNIYYDI